MPIQLPYFEKFPSMPTGFGGIMEGISKGFGIGKQAVQLPGELEQQRLQNEIKKQIAPYAGRQAEADLQKSLLEIEKLKQPQLFGGQNLSGPAKDAYSVQLLEDQFGKDHPIVKLATRNLESQIGGREALQAQRMNPLKYASADQKKLNDFERQIQIDRPDLSQDQVRSLSSAYLNKENSWNNEPLKPLSAQADRLRTAVYNSASTAALRNQAASMNNLVSELKRVDISPLKEYTGLGGTAKFNYQRLNKKERTQSWYDYDAFKNSIQIIAMDTLRKGFGTSVVPGYVYETLGKLSNPVDPIWGDPEQVEKRWNTTIDYLSRSAKNTTKQAERGATVSLEENEEDKKNKSIQNALNQQQEKVYVKRKSDNKKGYMSKSSYEENKSQYELVK